jgi:hypothetical protein
VKGKNNMQIEELSLNNNNLGLENKNEFLNSTLWKTINSGIDVGLRYLLPDLVEDEIIDLKDNLINYGLKDGVKKSINSVVETGKEAAGVLTGNYENITQLQTAIKNGGLVDKISDVLDAVIDKVQDAGKINSTMSKIIKNGKDSILTNVERNIESTLNNQVKSAEYVGKYIDNWKEYYNNKDFDGMEKEYKKIQKELKDLIPLENTINNARYVENIHNLIKNNGNNFELTDEELELAKKLNI